MSSTAHVISAILLLILITVMFGGFSLLWLLRDRLHGDQVGNFRAGHAHAGVLVILTLVVVDIADRAGSSGQRLWIIAAALFIFALAQSGGFFYCPGQPAAGTSDHNSWCRRPRSDRGDCRSMAARLRLISASVPRYSA
jgi:hypothetical protein